MVLTHHCHHLHTLSLSFELLQTSMHCTRELIQAKTIGGFSREWLFFFRDGFNSLVQHAHRLPEYLYLNVGHWR